MGIEDELQQDLQGIRIPEGSDPALYKGMIGYVAILLFERTLRAIRKDDGEKLLCFSEPSRTYPSLCTVVGDYGASRVEMPESLTRIHSLKTQAETYLKRQGYNPEIARSHLRGMHGKHKLRGQTFKRQLKQALKSAPNLERKYLETR